MRVWPGKPYPLGASPGGDGCNFALYSAVAEAVELCLFDNEGHETRVPLRERTAHVWHGFLPDVSVGQRYGYRVHGPYEPANGKRCNPAKLLIDPYAKALDGSVDWNAPVFAYRLGSTDLELDCRDDAMAVPKGIVIDNTFDWADDRHPAIPWNHSVIYEAHVKGFTVRNPDVPAELRGTYAGLAAPASVEYLKRLGVTAIELMPVHAFIDDKWLVDRGLVNYWGYNTINFFAPELRYSSRSELASSVNEFKEMVKTLHRANIEVILDVVYNHSAEGNQLGPTLSFRGIDNLTYYRTFPDDPSRYFDYTGCGNTLNARHPQVLQLIMDSLRYWVLDMHVDGFRFDLASALAREEHAVDRLASFFDVIHQDPVVSRVKLIAEPWDVADGGYQVGNFPVLWTEWNGRYRDTVRSWWKGDAGLAPDIAYRLAGSSDLYAWDGRHPWASINFVTAHDGFTLNDLVSYNVKHNDGNLEDGRDGSDYNLSWNCGHEGPTVDTTVLSLRVRQRKNFLATLFLSNGVPMLLSGDEIGRSQLGNNNAYCQDNPTSWLGWDLEPWQEDLLAFTRRLIQVRRAQPALQRKKFFNGKRILGNGVKDLTWLRPEGGEMTADDWETHERRAVGMVLAGEVLDEVDDFGNPLVGDTILVLMNASPETVRFSLPRDTEGGRWVCEFDTSRTAGAPPFVEPASTYSLLDRSTALFRLERIE